MDTALLSSQVDRIEDKPWKECFCGDLSYEELLRHLSPAERRAYWFGRQIGYFRLRKLGYKQVHRVWRSSKEWPYKRS